jgi:hypothetical protein
VDGKSIYDKLREPKFHLLSFSNGEIIPDDSQRQPSGLENNDPDLMDRYVIPLHADVAKVFGTDKPFNVLLRPDNYIAFISLDTSSDRVSAYFEDFVGRLA